MQRHKSGRQQRAVENETLWLHLPRKQSDQIFLDNYSTSVSEVSISWNSGPKLRSLVVKFSVNEKSVMSSNNLTAALLLLLLPVLASRSSRIYLRFEPEAASSRLLLSTKVKAFVAATHISSNLKKIVRSSCTRNEFPTLCRGD